MPWVLEYIAHWNTELVYLLFLITFLMIIAVFSVTGKDSAVLISFAGIKVTAYHILITTLVLAFLIFVWAQYRRERLEEYLREMLRRRYKE